MSLFHKLTSLFKRQTLEHGIDDELEFHLEARMKDNIAAGMTPDDARRDARLRFGNRTAAKERTRDADLATSIESVGQDLRYAIRWLRRSPGFTAAALLVLALGIGANTAVFTVVNGVLLRPLPFPESARLVLVSKLPKNHPFPSGPSLLDRDYVEFAQHADAFEKVATYGPTPVTLTGAGDPLRIPSAEVTSDFFGVLRVTASLGRTFLPEDAKQSAGRVVVLSDALWRSRFGGSAAVLGQKAILNGEPHTVVGVLPPGVALPLNAELWVPFEVRPLPNRVSARPVIGRLKQGVSAEQAEASLSTFLTNLPEEPGEAPQGYDTRIIPLKEWIVGDVRKSLVVFAAAVAFVLLIACANVANLLLIRAAARKQEIGVRAALGASRWRLVRQLLTESTLVSLGGGALGIGVAMLAVPALLALAPAGKIPRSDEIGIDGGVLWFTLGVSLATGVLFGLVPAFQATRRELRETLNETAKTSGRGQESIRAGLAVVEIALALVLLTGAGLMVRSFLRLRAVDPGFRAANLFTVEVNLPSFRYTTEGQMQAFHAVTLERISRLPGVLSTAAVNWLPLGQALIQGDFQVEGGRTLPPRYQVAKPAVSPGYLRTMGIRLIRGREFDRRDSADAPGVVMISQAVARTLWPGENPLGQRVSMEEKPTAGDWLTIVGVVDDVLQEGLKGKPAPAMYQPIAQVHRKFFLDHMTFVARTSGDAGSVTAGLRDVMREVDKDQPIRSIATMDQVIGGLTAEPEFQARLIGVFSLLALLLAAVGIYGVLACSVAERTREIGIRMALGASSGEVVRMVVRRTLWLALAGVALGTAGALAVTRYLAKFLFEIEPTDPMTFASVAGILLLVALAAALIPARRAARVFPMAALRQQ